MPELWQKNISILVKTKVTILEIIQSEIIAFLGEGKSKYSEAKESLSRSKIPKEMKEEIQKYLGGGSSYHEGGRVHGLTIPKVKGKKFKGVGLGADKKGFYVYTHRAASKPTNKKKVMGS